MPLPRPRLIVGLGNPGPRYANTRHNAGFLVVEEVRRRLKAVPAGVLSDSVVAKVPWPGGDLHLMEPSTYMNLSGLAVAPFAAAHGIRPEEILVCYDCLDLPLGRLRLRTKGSGGGHRGVESVIRECGTSDFPRLRLGIGRPSPGKAVVDYVLEPWTPEELPVAEAMVRAGAEALLMALELGVEPAMNRCNTSLPGDGNGPNSQM